MTRRTLKRTLLVTAAATLALPALAAAQGANTEITVGDNFFAPEKVSSSVGEQSYSWKWGAPQSNGLHNVAEGTGLFSSGKPETSGEFGVTPSAGTFLYICDIHGFINDGKALGMGGEIKVKPTATPQGRRTLITWATETTDTGKQFDVRQKVEKKKPKLVETKTKEIEAAFKLKKGKKYKFQVRSRQGKASSEWSPKLKLKG